MNCLAEDINEVKKQHDAVVRKQEIGHLLIGWEGMHLSQLGNLLLEEELQLVGSKAKRTIILLEKVLIIAKKRRQDGAIVHKGHIEVLDLTENC